MITKKKWELDGNMMGTKGFDELKDFDGLLMETKII